MAMDAKMAVLNNMQKNQKEYEKCAGITNKYLIAHVKNQLFSCYDGTTMSRLPSEQRKSLNIETLRFIVTEVYKLSPEQMDSIWANDVIIRMNVTSLVKEIVSDATDSLKEATLFNTRLIVLHECFPEYYKCTYPETYDVIDVIQASGSTLKTLCKAGRVDADRLSLKLSSADYPKKRAAIGSGTSGEIVDKIAYNALSVFLKTATSTDDIGEHLEALAHPSILKIKSLGVTKVINARGCWKSLLDFYYLNSSAAAQTIFFEKYKRLRMETQEYDAISAFMDEVELDQDLD